MKTMTFCVFTIIAIGLCELRVKLVHMQIDEKNQTIGELHRDLEECRRHK